ncbi:hypothetical protein B0A52_06339 [Exophiala mesophila]|uniref:C2H2-type domain-containing protein n=1 Tax=Exophiala mesophila TaxID=212818 RepID=A0A438N1U3_EXOME|nr:hypothetical protein B0A52_06339 [Exophiala mesophila]
MTIRITKLSLQPTHLNPTSLEFVSSLLWQRPQTSTTPEHPSSAVQQRGRAHTGETTHTTVERFDASQSGRTQLTPSLPTRGFLPSQPDSANQAIEGDTLPHRPSAWSHSGQGLSEAAVLDSPLLQRQGMASQVVQRHPLQYPSSSMVYPNDTSALYSTLDHMAATQASYRPVAYQQQIYMPSPQVISPDLRYHRRSSNSPQAGVGLPAAVRDRTPIRHQRTGVSRNRSRGHARDDMLLAYTPDQNRLVHSQSAPAVPVSQVHGASSMGPVYNMPPFGAAVPSLGPYHGQGTFFDSSMMQPSRHHDETPDFSLTPGDVQSYYMMGEGSSHGSTVGLSGPNSPSPMYMSAQLAQPQQGTPSIQGMPLHGYSNLPLTLESSPAELEVIPSRPKPQCWDHGCNGRQFSTFSNLLRHQREKSGSAIKATCPHCGTEFTRTTARNGHMSGGKCKGKADAEASNLA